MKILLIGLLAFGSISAFAAGPLIVKQSLNTSFYQDEIMDIHMGVFENELDAELRKYECLQGDISTNITLKPVRRIFSAGEPGKVNLTLTTTCHNPDLTAIQFGVSGFGFDEDYTQFNIKFTTKKGSIIVKFCAYGLHNDARNCPDFGSYKPVFSTGTR